MGNCQGSASDKAQILELTNQINELNNTSNSQINLLKYKLEIIQNLLLLAEQKYDNERKRLESTKLILLTQGISDTTFSTTTLNNSINTNNTFDQYEQLNIDLSNALIHIKNDFNKFKEDIISSFADNNGKLLFFISRNEFVRLLYSTTENISKSDAQILSLRFLDNNNMVNIAEFLDYLSSSDLNRHARAAASAVRLSQELLVLEESIQIESPPQTVVITDNSIDHTIDNTIDNTISNAIDKKAIDVNNQNLSISVDKDISNENKNNNNISNNIITNSAISKSMDLPTLKESNSPTKTPALKNKFRGLLSKASKSTTNQTDTSTSVDNKISNDVIDLNKSIDSEITTPIKTLDNSVDLNQLTTTSDTPVDQKLVGLVNKSQTNVINQIPVDIPLSTPVKTSKFSSLVKMMQSNKKTNSNIDNSNTPTLLSDDKSISLNSNIDSIKMDSKESIDNNIVEAKSITSNNIKPVDNAITKKTSRFGSLINMVKSNNKSKNNNVISNSIDTTPVSTSINIDDDMNSDAKVINDNFISSKDDIKGSNISYSNDTK